MTLEELQQSVAKVAESIKTMDKTAELKALTEKVNSTETLVRELSQRAPAAGQKKEECLTFGQALVKSESFQKFLAGESRKVHFEKSTATLGSNGPRQRVAAVGTTVGGILAPRFLDVKTPKPTSASIIEVARETSWTNNAAAVLEGAKKPESGIEWTTIQKPIQVIAHFMPVTKQLLADDEAFAAWIDDRMQSGLDEKVENLIINGTGVAPQLDGLMNVGNYTAHGLIQGSGDTNLDLIRKCKVAISKVGKSANCVILNPSDYDAITALKATDGQYLMLNPAAAEEPRIWGLQVIQSAAMTQGQFLVCDLSECDYFERQVAVLEAFEQDADNVQKNLVTLRAETRAAFVVYSPIAFVGGALW